MFSATLNKLFGTSSSLPLNRTSSAVAEGGNVYDVMKLDMEQRGTVHVGHIANGGSHVAVFKVSNESEPKLYSVAQWTSTVPGSLQMVVCDAIDVTLCNPNLIEGGVTGRQMFDAARACSTGRVFDAVNYNSEHWVMAFAQQFNARVDLSQCGSPDTTTCDNGQNPMPKSKAAL